MKLFFLTGSRGEWGYIRPILRLCQDREIEFRICATNMHLLAGFGLSMGEIEKDGFTVTDPLYMAFDGHNRFTMTKSMGVCLMGVVDAIMRDKPDWIILAGDRGEQLMGAVAGGFTYTPVAHIQAGELSGNIDGMTRHAIGKFVHMHFAANEDAGQRLLKLGEEPFRVKVVGAPQLDELVQGLYSTPERLQETYEVDGSKPYFLVVQHPVTEEYEEAETQISITIQALKRFDMHKIWILPNNDAGSDMTRRGILKGRDTNTLVFKNLPREDYLGFLRHAKCIVGNSSSGLLEAPTFGVPAVNIGRRQSMRLRGANVIDVVDFNKDKIVAAITRALTSGFRDAMRNIPSPYGDGKSSARILDILDNTPRDSRLLVKQLTY